MTDPRDDLDAWMNAQVRPLPPPPGTFELIRKRARRRKVTRAAAGQSGSLFVAASLRPQWASTDPNKSWFGGASRNGSSPSRVNASPATGSRT